jgi:hypothetical protein
MQESEKITEEYKNFPENEDDLLIPFCDKCRSKQVRTTKKHLVCIRCGHKEELKDGVL